jgi:hypothetical protein
MDECKDMFDGVIGHMGHRLIREMYKERSLQFKSLILYLVQNIHGREETGLYLRAIAR